MQRETRTARTVNARTSGDSPKVVLATVAKTCERHPEALTPKMLRKMMHCADAGDPDFALLRLAIVRIKRSVFLSIPHFEQFLEMHRALPPAPARAHGRKSAKDRAAQDQP